MTDAGNVLSDDTGRKLMELIDGSPGARVGVDRRGAGQHITIVEAGDYQGSMPGADKVKYWSGTVRLPFFQDVIESRSMTGEIDSSYSYSGWFAQSDRCWLVEASNLVTPGQRYL